MVKTITRKEVHILIPSYPIVFLDKLFLSARF